MFPKELNPKLERVKFALQATGIKLDSTNPAISGTHTRGYLPHVKREGASYFVTFRLADSLPREVLLELQRERADRMRHLAVQQKSRRIEKTEAKPADLEREIERDYFRKVERVLDQNIGACHLRRSEMADLVASAMGRFAGKRYELHAWVVMPNHVHVVVWPMPNQDLSAILKGWKGFTAREANRILNRTGETFWQRESFDHWIRDDAEKARICRYVTNNPVKAGLCAKPEEWRCSSAWMKPEKTDS